MKPGDVVKTVEGIIATVEERFLHNDVEKCVIAWFEAYTLKRAEVAIEHLVLATEDELKVARAKWDVWISKEEKVDIDDADFVDTNIVPLVTKVKK